jgi:hypothetical protein
MMSTRGQHWMLCVVVVIIACAGVADAQQAAWLGLLPEEVLQLPAIKVIALARLSELRLSLTAAPATVQSIEEAGYARTPETLDNYAHCGVARHGTNDSPSSGVV